MGAGSEQDAGPRVHGDLAVAAAGVPTGTSAERGYQVFGSPHEADGVADGGDGRCGQHPARGLAECENVAWCEGGHLLGRLGLGEHHGLVRGVGEYRQVLGVVVGAGRVDPHDRADRVEQGLAQRLTCPGFVLGGDGILQVEDDAVGRRGRLCVSVGTVGGAEQQRRSGQVGGHRLTSGPGSEHSISAERTATATTSPSWLCAVCSKVTTPWPGRLRERRLSTTVVSA